jgi:DNA-binding CsgD family transcriptional regulator
LSVFAPGYDVNPEDARTGVADVGAELEAIEVICADDVPIQGCESSLDTVGADQGRAAVGLARSEIRELLDRLVEQSLVSIHMTADTARYFLLESLRLFAEDRLAERSTEEVDEEARLAARYYHYYRDKVLRAQAEWFGPAERELLSWAVGAWSNILRAIDTSLAAGEPVVGLQIAVSLRAIFTIGSSETRGRIEQALAATQASGPELSELQVVAMAQAAWLALFQGCPQDAEELLERCVAACDGHAANTECWRDRPEIDIGLPAVVDYTWGVELMLVRRDPRAIAVFVRAREKFDGIADHVNAGACGTNAAMAAGFFGSAEEALTIAHRQLEWNTAAGAQWGRSWAQIALAIALTKHGDVQEALQVGRDALAYLLALGDQWGTTWVVHIRMWSLARLISDQSAAGNASRSSLVTLATEIAYLAGGVKAQRARLGVQIENLGPFFDETSTAEKTARDVLGQPTYADIKKSGSGLFLEHSELERIALGTWSITASSPAKTCTMGWENLSAAEQEVAILAAAGWPNSAIGARRGTSTRTTDVQMSSIFQKLMITSREDIVRFVPETQRNRVSAERSQISRQSRHKPRSIHPRPQD